MTFFLKTGSTAVRWTGAPVGEPRSPASPNDTPDITSCRFHGKLWPRSILPKELCIGSAGVHDDRLWGHHEESSTTRSRRDPGRKRHLLPLSGLPGGNHDCVQICRRIFSGRRGTSTAPPAGNRARFSPPAGTRESHGYTPPRYPGEGRLRGEHLPRPEIDR